MAAPITVITTVKNEEAVIAEFANMIFAATPPPAELIVADACSSDGTVAKLDNLRRQGLPISFQSFVCSRSVGRNWAVRKASHDLVICIDAGVLVDKNCFKAVLQYFADHPKAEFAGGAIRGRYQGILEQAFSVLIPGDPSLSCLESGSYLPTSRLLAWRRKAFLLRGEYPIANSYSEDIEFARLLRRQGVHFGFIGNAVGFWRPRSTWGDFFRQYMLYARGEAASGYPAVGPAVKVLLYLVGLFLLLAGVLASPLWLGLLLLLAVAYAGMAMQRSYGLCSQWQVAALAPVVEIVHDSAEICGFLLGWSEYVGRLGRNKSPLR